MRNFLRRELVLWRRTPRGRGDVAIDQSQTILAISRNRLIGKTGLVQSAKQPIAAAVAGKHAARAIAAVCRRRQAND